MPSSRIEEAPGMGGQGALVAGIPRRRLATVLAAGFVVCAIGLTAVALRRPLVDRQADLNVYYGAIRAVARGHPLYGYHAPNGDPFTYPPFAVLALWPVGWVPEQVLRVVWTLSTCAAVLAVGACLARRAPAGSRWLAMWAAGLVLLVSAPTQSDLRFGQISVLLVLLALADAAGMTPRRMRGVVVGITAAVKLTPLLFIVYLLVTRQRRAAAAATATFAGSTGLAWAVLPGDSWTYWRQSVFATSRIGDLAATGNQSINGMLLRLPLMPAHRVAAWLLAALVLGAAGLYRAYFLHGRRRHLEAAATVGCATVVLSPVSWMHHQLWTVLAALLLLARPTTARRAAAATITALMIVPVPRPPGCLTQFLATNARGLCAAALCGLGLVTAWRTSTASTRRERGVWRLVSTRVATAAGTAVLLVSGALVITGLIQVHFAPTDRLVAARWTLALDPVTPPGSLSPGRRAGDAPPLIYTAAYTTGGWVKTVGSTTAAISRLQVQITSTGPSYTVPLRPGPEPGTKTFAMITNTVSDITLVAFDPGAPASVSYTTTIDVTYHPDGQPIGRRGR